MAEPCHCPEPNETCERIGPGIPMVGYRHAVCSGRSMPRLPPVTPEMSERYRELWDAQARGEVPRDKALPLPQGVKGVDVPLRVKLWRFAEAIRKWTRAGKPFLKPEPLAQRLSICSTCPFYQAASKICGHKDCGCGLEHRTVLGILKKPGKAQLGTELCPDGRWPALTDDDVVYLSRKGKARAL